MVLTFSFTSWYLDFTDTFEGTKYLKKELEQKLKSQNARFLQQQEANESLTMKIVELQQECETIQKNSSTNNSNTANQMFVFMDFEYLIIQK